MNNHHKASYYYIELFVTTILSTLFNYSIVCNLTEIKKIPKSTIVIFLFLLSSLFQIIPIIVLNYDIDNLTNNQELILQLDHIDGDKTNNELINLRFLCPNCHSQTPTYANKKRNKK